MSYTGFVQAGLQIGLDSILVRPKRGLYNIIAGDGSNLSDIIAMATVEEHHLDQLEVTEHPVQQGAPISDHAYKRPAEVVLHLAWSNSPNQDNGLISAAVTTVAANNAAVRSIANAGAIATAGASLFTTVQASLNGVAIGQMQDVYNKLLQLQGMRALFDLYTGKRVYNNMICTTLSTPTDYKSENSLFITMVCKQIIIVNTQTVQLPKQTQADPSATASPVNNGGISAISSSPIPTPSGGTWQAEQVA